jgi:hypothetical protein
MIMKVNHLYTESEAISIKQTFKGGITKRAMKVKVINGTPSV